MPKTPSSKKTKPQHRKKVKFFQGLGLILFGLTLLFLVELVLRFLPFGVLSQAGEDPFVGFSGTHPLYTRYRAADGTLRAKTTPYKLQWFNEQDFRVRKDPGTFRIFTLGGSTTYGHPYAAPTSFGGWLERLLNKQAEPGRRFEVINAGGISYASYRVVLVLREILTYQPDLIIIYSGHNEFLEARTYPQLLNRPPALIKIEGYLAKLRLYNMLNKIYRAVRSDFPSKKKKVLDSGATLLPIDVETLLDKSVGLEYYQRDSLLAQGVFEHFRISVARMIELCNEKGVPVVFCRPLDNLKDFSPFKSMASSSFSSNQRLHLLRLVSQGIAQLNADQTEKTLATLKEAVRLDPFYADSYFYLGRVLLSLGDSMTSKKAFIQARDLDVCPLRAQEPIHQALREETSRAGVTLLDLPPLFESRCPGHILGSEVLMDHIHPDPEGNLLIALTIMDWMRSQGLWGNISMPNQESVQRIYREVMDSMTPEYLSKGVVNLAKVLIWAKKYQEVYSLLQKRWEEVKGNGEAQFMMAMVLYLSGQAEQAIIHYQKALALIPQHRMALTQLAELYGRIGDFEAARKAYLRAIEFYPQDVPLLVNFGTLLAQNGRQDEAMEYYRKVEAIKPESPALHNNIGMLYMVLKKYTQAIEAFQRARDSDPKDPVAYHNLGLAYTILEKPQEAEQNLLQALSLNPDYASARNNLGNIYRKTSRVAEAEEQFRLAMITDPNRAEPYINLGLLYHERGDDSLALQIVLLGEKRVPGESRLKRLAEVLSVK
ncbi:MAG TPA: tetratricopeptide repeat protein [archaeon]|nr:tetratricopeptide repeat protein [archaeon]